MRHLMAIAALMVFAVKLGAESDPVSYLTYETVFEEGPLCIQRSVRMEKRFVENAGERVGAVKVLKFRKGTKDQKPQLYFRAILGLLAQRSLPLPRTEVFVMYEEQFPLVLRAYRPFSPDVAALATANRMLVVPLPDRMIVYMVGLADGRRAEQLANALVHFALIRRRAGVPPSEAAPLARWYENLNKEFRLTAPEAEHLFDMFRGHVTILRLGWPPRETLADPGRSAFQ